jgi:hypothetical protein
MLHLLVLFQNYLITAASMALLVFALGHQSNELLS